MKNLPKKIISSLAAVGFATLVIATTFYFTAGKHQGLVRANILDGVIPSRICSVEFVNPKGAAYPVNGVVEIQAVNVTIDSGAATFCDGMADVISTENISGTDLVDSIITFADGSNACNAVYNGNKIVLPDNFATSCTVDIKVGGVVKNAAELSIEPIVCADLQTSILLGKGTGFQDIDPADLGTFASTETAGGLDFTTPITSVDLSYPNTTVQGAKTFQIHLDLVPDSAIDPINGITEQAKIVNNNGLGSYQIKVKNEGLNKEAETTLNLAYVFNDLLGVDSPFFAYLDNASNTTLQLQATEMGVHGNSYQCLVNGAANADCAFGGGTDGQNAAEGVLTLPMTLDNELVQGETAIVFAAGSSGELEWISAHPSILEVTSLTEAAQQGDSSTVDFVDVLLDDNVAVENADEDIADGGVYNINNCQKTFDENDNFVSESCTVEISIPVQYDISGVSYTANVSVGEDVIPVSVQGSSLAGFVTGSGTYTTGGGLSASLKGNVTGVVSGFAAGQYSGTVNGQISAPITSSVSMVGVVSELTASNVEAGIGEPVLIEGTLTDVANSFSSTVKKQDTDVSHISLLFAKKPGKTILSAIDSMGCIATFNVDVIKKQVILETQGFKKGDVLDVADMVQINAFAGAANAEKNEYENITAASGIEWISSNESVATIDGTGLLTALKPGVTNITARYDTGVAEIGTIESLPLQITVNKIAGLRVTFDETTEQMFDSDLIEAAHESVIIAIHDPKAAGHIFTIEGQQVNISLPVGTYDNDISKVAAITGTLTASLNALVNANADPIVSVTNVEGYPGMLVLKPLNQGADNDNDFVQDIDENGIIDIDTTALEEDVAILPTYNMTINLPASQTYGVRVIAQYDNGATKLLPPTQFKWVNTPVNYLEQASLDSGFLKRGQISGHSTVLAEFLNADGSVVQSNYLNIEVASGPVIEYVQRIGSGSITKGSRIKLRTKITDVDNVNDIASVTTSLVFSTGTTYNEINADGNAIWFAAENFLNEAEVVEQNEGTEGDQNVNVPVALPFGIYDIPVEIPVDANLFDGVYKLILGIADKSNHTLNYVYPIRIGEIGAGDVNGDGLTNMVDVIVAFQIAAGILPNPTATQLQAANVDGVGGVTLVDVILLFNLVSN